MKKLFSFVLIAFIFSLSINAQDFFEIELTVKGFDNLKGIVRVCLANSEKDFMEKCFRSKEVRVINSEMKIIFSNIPKGDFAISLFHDEDENGKLNTGGIFGLPSEDYGFSNNPRIRFGPPKFKKCIFKVDKNVKLSINL